MYDETILKIKFIFLSESLTGFPLIPANCFQCLSIPNYVRCEEDHQVCLYLFPALIFEQMAEDRYITKEWHLSFCYCDIILYKACYNYGLLVTHYNGCLSRPLDRKSTRLNSSHGS